MHLHIISELIKTHRPARQTNPHSPGVSYYAHMNTHTHTSCIYIYTMLSARNVHFIVKRVATNRHAVMVCPAESITMVCDMWDWNIYICICVVPGWILHSRCSADSLLCDALFPKCGLLLYFCCTIRCVCVCVRVECNRLCTPSVMIIIIWRLH